MPHQHLPILFVDDDPISHRVIQSFFKDWEVTHVYSGKEALGALRFYLGPLDFKKSILP